MGFEFPLYSIQIVYTSAAVRFSPPTHPQEPLISLLPHILSSSQLERPAHLSSSIDFSAQTNLNSNQFSPAQLRLSLPSLPSRPASCFSPLALRLWWASSFVSLRSASASGELEASFSPLALSHRYRSGFFFFGFSLRVFERVSLRLRVWLVRGCVMKGCSMKGFLNGCFMNGCLNGCLKGCLNWCLNGVRWNVWKGFGDWWGCEVGLMVFDEMSEQQ